MKCPLMIGETSQCDKECAWLVDIRPEGEKRSESVRVCAVTALAMGKWKSMIALHVNKGDDETS